MKKLIIAEKPSVARDICAALPERFTRHDGYWESDRWVVGSAVGHLVTLDVPTARTGGRSLGTLPIIPDHFDLAVIEERQKAFDTLKSLLHRADIDKIYNACDAGREGELIFDWIYRLAQANKTVLRVWMQSMTPESIRAAIEQAKPSSQYKALRDAANCRAEADWLIGINGSRALTLLYRLRYRRAEERLSVGRVQTPTLSIIVDLERRITNFVPQPYWDLSVKVGHEKQHFTAEYGQRIDDAQTARSIVEKVKAYGRVDKIEDQTTEALFQPPRLFNLTSLQREANRILGLSAKQTLDIAQTLYEQHKVISYPRTDSQALPQDYGPTVCAVLAAMQGRWAQAAKTIVQSGWVDEKNKRIFNDAEVSDHFAIIPTENALGSTDETTHALFDLIQRRFVTAFYPAAKALQTQRNVWIDGHAWKASGRIWIDPGWRVLLSESSEDDAQALGPIPDPAHLLDVRSEEKKTRPPSRMTEAALLLAMENAGQSVEEEEISKIMKGRGLGTPATRAQIIEKLLSSEGGRQPYIVRQGKDKVLVPTQKGTELIDFLRENQLDLLASAQMTGQWELRLHAIEQSRLDGATFMKAIEQTTRKMVDIIRAKAATLGWDPQTDSTWGATLSVHGATCPVCGAGIVANNRLITCEKTCGFRAWREVFSHCLSEEEIARLLGPARRTQPIAGLKSKEGKSFTAALVLDEENRIRLAALPAEPGRPWSGGACPKCRANRWILRDGDHPRIQCECGLILWRKIGSHVLTEAELTELLTAKRTSRPVEMTSKAGKPFKARFKMEDSGKIVFDFDETSHKR